MLPADRVYRGRMRPLLVVLVSLAALAGGGCATARVDDPPLAVTLSVTGLRDDERALLRDQVCALPGVKDCALVDVEPPPPPEPKSAPTKKKRDKKRSKKRGKSVRTDAVSVENGADVTISMGENEAATDVRPPTQEARVLFTYRGSLGELRHHIASLPHPGLEARTAQVTLTYRGFDNLAPTVTILEPADGLLLNEKKILVRATVPDVDIASVDIDGERVAPSPPGSYEAEPELLEGENQILVRATDRAGNATEARVTVVVDTTPPAMEVEIVVLPGDQTVVKGNVKDAESVTIDGKPVDVDFFGRFERQFATDPDTTNVVVVAKDALGNEKKITRSAKQASAMSGD